MREVIRSKLSSGLAASIFFAILSWPSALLAGDWPLKSAIDAACQLGYPGSEMASAIQHEEGKEIEAFLLNDITASWVLSYNAFVESSYAQLLRAYADVAHSTRNGDGILDSELCSVLQPAYLIASSAQKIREADGFVKSGWLLNELPDTDLPDSIALIGEQCGVDFLAVPLVPICELDPEQ